MGLQAHAMAQAMGEGGGKIQGIKVVPGCLVDFFCGNPRADAGDSLFLRRAHSIHAAQKFRGGFRANPKGPGLIRAVVIQSAANIYEDAGFLPDCGIAGHGVR